MIYAARRSFLFAPFLFAVVARGLTAPATDRLLELGLAELMKVKVTSVERRESDVGDTAAAITVLTAEDIRRSGAASIPDVLRRVPGLTVSRVNGNTWAVSARGFNSALSNKLLVLIDGRSVYSPLYAGVFWDIQDMPLESIERIEVIRGPGGTLWGSNAVNGIINIIRKPAADQRGLLVSVGAGSEEKFNAKAIAGAKAGGVDVAVYGKYREFDDLRRSTDGGDNGDGGRLTTGGARFDGGDESAAWTVSGDVHSGRFAENRTILSPFVPLSSVKNVDTDAHGGNVLARMRRKLVSGTVTAQTFWDRTERRIAETFHEVRNTYDFEINHALSPTGRQTFTWGANARVTEDRVGDSFTVAWDETAFSNNLFSLFLQDQIQLTHRLWLTLGSKFERNDFTGWEAQPSGRLGWRVGDNSLLWAAISRAVRTPTRFDRHVRAAAQALPGPTFLSIYGDDDFRSEEVLAYEAGYRASPNKRFFVDVAAFFNKYDDLSTFEAGAPLSLNVPAPHTVFPFVLDNRAWGESFGAELSPRYELFPWWTLEAEYSYLHLRLHADSDSRDFVVANSEANDPVHQAALLSDWRLPRNFFLSGAMRWVGERKNRAVDGYTAIDASIGWTPAPSLTAELIGQNLFETSHREFAGAAEVEQTIFGRLTWRTQ